MISMLFALSVTISSILHVGQIAQYEYSINNDKLHLTFTMEKDELYQHQLSKDCELKKTTALCVYNYLISNSTIQINHQKLEFELDKSSTNNNHFILNLSAKLESTDIKSITIQNSCFFDFDPNFKNRIMLNLDSFNSSYLLTKGHSEITIQK